MDGGGSILLTCLIYSSPLVSSLLAWLKPHSPARRRIYLRGLPSESGWEGAQWMRGLGEAEASELDRVWLTVSPRPPPCGRCPALWGRGCRGSGCWTWGGSPHRWGGEAKELDTHQDLDVLKKWLLSSIIVIMFIPMKEDNVATGGNVSVHPSQFCMTVILEGE